MIQQRFLNSIKEQNYDKFILNVVQFGETGIEDELIRNQLNYRYTDLGNQLFSHTKVMLHALKSFPESKIIWTTVDIELPAGFLKAASSDLDTEWMLLCHPHVVDGYQHKSNYETWKHFQGSGIDLVGFSPEACKSIENDLRTYHNKGWGGFEHQLVAFGHSNKPTSKTMKNLAPKFYLKKTTNPSESLGETSQRQQSQWNDNYQRWEPWLKKRRGNRKYLDLKYCVLVFNTNLYLRAPLYLSFKKGRLKNLKSSLILRTKSILQKGS